MYKKLTGLLFLLIVNYLISMFFMGCAQIGAPSGGPKDTVAPVLVKSIPNDKTINFKGNKITLSFNEYVELQDLQNNLLVSPTQKSSPTISNKLKSVTIKFKDTLSPNTTYTINFGNAIKDLNEGNVVNNFTYTFSTGNEIDSLQLKGKVLIAETNLVDSTLMVLLYKNAHDTSVITRKPDYIARLKGDGSYVFNNLPDANFNVYALKDGDGNKWYNAKTEVFAYNNEEVNTGKTNKVPTLFAFAEKKPDPSPEPALKKKTEKYLKYNSNIFSGEQDLLEPMNLTFQTPLKKIDFDSIVLCDSNYKIITHPKFNIDSTKKKIVLVNTWIPDQYLNLLVFTGAFEDSNNLKLKTTDTIPFKTKSISQYGSLKITFTNLDLSKYPILIFMNGQELKYKCPLVSNVWKTDLMAPAEYEVRILYDDNNNGQWDPGNYDKKIQPEKGIVLPQKISIKADWENERDITL